MKLISFSFFLIIALFTACSTDSNGKSDSELSDKDIHSTITDDNISEKDNDAEDQDDAENDSSSEHTDIDEANGLIFTDKNLKNCIAEHLKKEDDTILEHEIPELKELDCSSKDISSLEGIEQLTDLEVLDLSYNNFKAFKELTKLDKLKELDLSGNNLLEITDLKNIQSVTTLRLSDTKFKDFTTVASLENLKVLYLNENSLTDISQLSAMKNLGELYLKNNELSDISPLKNLTNITILSISENKISDISVLSSLSLLEKLYMYSNPVSDISAVSDLTKLTYLSAKNCKIEDISPISALTNLKKLYLSENSFNKLDNLASLENLEELYVRKLNIYDLMPIKDLLKLQKISLKHNQITDISPLSKMVELTTVWVEENCIADFSALDELTSKGLKIDGKTEQYKGCTVNAICGNGVREFGEECDFKEAGFENSCDESCKLIPSCGNGKIEDTETCDDGNQEDGDGCSSSCAVEETSPCFGRDCGKNAYGCHAVNSQEFFCVCKDSYYFNQDIENPGCVEKSASTSPDDEGEVFVGDFVVITNSSTDLQLKESTGTLDFLPYSYLDQNPDYLTVSPSADENEVYIDAPEHLLRLPDNFSSAGVAKRREKAGIKRAEVGQKKEFITGVETDKLMEATLQYAGTKCEVWVEDTEEIDRAEAEKIGKEFDSAIYPLVTENFYTPSDVDQNGKVTILLHDIENMGNGTSIKGYFKTLDLFKYPGKSNHQEILYVDTIPSMHKNKTAPLETASSLSTIVHEFQHLVFVNRNILIEQADKVENGALADIPPTWINEALSMAAQHMYEGAQEGRIDAYNSSKSIANGHSLFEWGYNGQTLPNYGLSYLFLQYLRIQAGQDEAIYREIIEHAENDHAAIEHIIQTYIDEDMTLGEFITNFRIATVLNEPEGAYGFNGEEAFSNLMPIYFNLFGESAELPAGGSIIVPIKKLITSPEDKGENVIYKSFMGKE